jgi:Xaa-Pro aminopeptidase
MLNSSERAWLNAYHARVRRELAPLLGGDPAAQWLDQATAAI